MTATAILKLKSIVVYGEISCSTSYADAEGSSPAGATY